MRGSALVAAALLLGLAASAGAQERKGSEPARGSWFSRLWPFGRKAEAPKQSQQDDAEQKRLAAVEAASAARSRELAAYERRQAVCLRLLEIAVQTRDEDLERRAEDLNRLAWDTYLLRTSHLPTPAGGGFLAPVAPQPQPAGAASGRE